MAFTKHFPGQLPDEKIVKILHRHWFNILSHFISLLLVAFAALFFLFLSPVLTALFGLTLQPLLVSFVVTLILLFVWVYGFFLWIEYYFDVWIITEERVLNIEQKGLFTRIASEVHFNRVQDVTTHIEGLLPTLLHYGDIFIQTAGEQKRFHFRNISNPDECKDQIMHLVKQFQTSAPSNQGEKI